MLAGVVSPVIARMLEEREAEAEGLRLRLLAGDASSVNVVAHPALRARFEQRVANLRESLSDPDNRAEVASILAELTEEVVIHPAKAGAMPEVEMAADLPKMVGFANAESRPPRRGRLSESTIKVVAGTRFHLNLRPGLVPSHAGAMLPFESFRELFAALA